MGQQTGAHHRQDTRHHTLGRPCLARGSVHRGCHLCLDPFPRAFPSSFPLCSAPSFFVVPRCLRKTACFLSDPPPCPFLIRAHAQGNHRGKYTVKNGKITGLDRFAWEPTGRAQCHSKDRTAAVWALVRCHKHDHVAWRLPLDWFAAGSEHGVQQSHAHWFLGGFADMGYCGHCRVCIHHCIHTGPPPGTARIKMEHQNPCCHDAGVSRTSFSARAAAAADMRTRHHPTGACASSHRWTYKQS